MRKGDRWGQLEFPPRHSHAEVLSGPPFGAFFSSSFGAPACEHA